jgi:hypothetical protein
MLRVKSRFKSSYGSWNVGDVIDNPALEPGLIASSPESFEVILADKPADVDADKMIRRGRPKNEII